ncbi:MAG: hypothetical protein HYT11_01625 [Candidatus Levybacteria bacterium]|nr:hypothetical protein [Candidatus Levybacteria bacterium]
MDEPKTDGDFKKLFTDVIKKQIIVLGPDITLAKARNVKGLIITDDGTVTDIKGDPKELIQDLIDQFVQLSGLIVKKTMEPLLANYPGLASMAMSPAHTHIPGQSHQEEAEQEMPKPFQSETTEKEEKNQ